MKLETKILLAKLPPPLKKQKANKQTNPNANKCVSIPQYVLMASFVLLRGVNWKRGNMFLSAFLGEGTKICIFFVFKEYYDTKIFKKN